MVLVIVFMSYMPRRGGTRSRCLISDLPSLAAWLLGDRKWVMMTAYNIVQVIGVMLFFPAFKCNSQCFFRV
jgi:hypothetical protein